MKLLKFSDYHKHTCLLFKYLKFLKLQDMQFIILKLIYFYFNDQLQVKKFSFKTNQLTHTTLEVVNCCSYLTLIMLINH